MDFHTIRRFAGCWYLVKNRYESMPQISLKAHTTIMSATSRTILTQTFMNSSKDKSIDQVSYTFPLYDGVSVVGFKCRVASRVIYGLVKEKEEARADYKDAVSRGETAGLLEQLPEASDVFTTTIGNVPAGESVVVEITYLGELKHDAKADGVRFTIPTVVAPRYGSLSLSRGGLPTNTATASTHGKGIEITVDVAVDDGAMIRSVQSPSHPIGITLGRTSTMEEDSADPHRASATLSLGSAELEKDFVLIVIFKDQDIPRALLEHHPKFPNQRALMATLVPSFKLAPSRPEIVFVVDRSGSMAGKTIETVKSALQNFLKSLPVGVKFNICSFGSNHSFLWERSKSYDQSSLNQALKHVETFSADFGGTEMFNPVKDTVKRRYKDMDLEVMILTDGEIWNQKQLFELINESAAQGTARFFSLGIGPSASHSLVEGIARAGRGFAQSVGNNEKLDKKVVRMLKGALTPHVNDYTLEVKYENGDEEFELIEKVTDSLSLVIDTAKEKQPDKPESISLFNPAAKKENDKEEAKGEKYAHLPTVSAPKLLQAPHNIPPLFPFIRTAAYLLMSPEASQGTPKFVVLRATSAQGPLELEIPVQDIGKGETIHQLAAKKAVGELEEGRGWIIEAKDTSGKKLKDRYDGRWEELVEREAVRLGVRFQVGGKFCSFVAVEKNKASDEEWETLGEARQGNVISGAHAEDPAQSTNFGGDLYSGRKFTRFCSPGNDPGPKAYFRGLIEGGDKRRLRQEGSEESPLPQQSIKASFNATAYAAHAAPAPMAQISRPSPSYSMYQQQPPYPSSVPAPTLGSKQRRGVAADTSYSSEMMDCIAPGANMSLVDDDESEDVGFCLFDDDPAPVQREKPSPKLDSDYGRMQALIALQTFVGSWNWSDELFRALGIEKASVSVGANAKGVMATLLAVAFLETKLKGEMEVWELVVEKARGWLAGKLEGEALASLVDEKIKGVGKKYFDGK